MPVATRVEKEKRDRGRQDLGGVMASPPKRGQRIPIKPPSSQERMIFFRSFATLFGAGVPIGRSLEVLGEQAKEPQFRMFLGEMGRDVLHGYSLTAVFDRAREVFSSYHVRMVRVGEMTGNLEGSLAQMALAEEKAAELHLKIRSALTYPAWCLALAGIFLMFVPPYLMDGLFSAVSATGGELPALTVVVQSVFTVFRHPVFQLAVVTAIGTLCFYYGRITRSERVRQWLFARALSFRGTRKLAESMVTARFARAFSTMLEAGVNPGLAVRLAGEEVGTPDYKDAGVQALYALENGATFLEAIKKIPHLRSYFHELLRAGEETGTMSELTQRAALIAEEEVEHQLELFAALLEPLIMVGIGGVVGILVISSMLPMLSVLDSL